MEGWFEFALERYNYWIVIVLMMTGLYIVVARGNLVKKVVGLNVFQTSVFIFYITIGKIAGSTAPIYMGADLKKMKEGSHGEGHEGGNADHGKESLHEMPDGAAQPIGDGEAESASLHEKIENPLAGASGNDLKAALKELEPESVVETAPSLHDAPAGAEANKIANDAFAGVKKPDLAEFDLAGEESLHGADAANTLGDAIESVSHGAGEIIYTNPLPHVLILTAIVVGVATTAVGLALAVRIREAYGTIEEDELEAIDNVAEFGDAAAGATS